MHLPFLCLYNFNFYLIYMHVFVETPDWQGYAVCQPVGLTVWSVCPSRSLDTIHWSRFAILINYTLYFTNTYYTYFIGTCITCTMCRNVICCLMVGPVYTYVIKGGGRKINFEWIIWKVAVCLRRIFFFKFCHAIAHKINYILFINRNNTLLQIRITISILYFVIFYIN